MRPLFQDRVARDGPTELALAFALDPDGPAGPARMTYRVPLVAGDGAVAGVREAYASIRPVVRDALRAAGTTRLCAWVEEGDLWLYQECADLAVAEAGLADAAVYQSWWRSIEPWVAAPPRRTREVFRCD
jgi:hypothetical protein